MTHYEIVPAGDSLARDPRFTTRTTSEDGHVWESNPYMPYLTRQAAAANLFPEHAWPGGYPLAYYTEDGTTVCGECLMKAFDDPDAPDFDAIHDGKFTAQVEEERYTGLMCDTCNHYIIEPFCVECGTSTEQWIGTLFAFPAFYGEEGEHLLCAHCMAERVTKGEATKTGKLRYDVKGGHFYDGSYAS